MVPLTHQVGHRQLRPPGRPQRAAPPTTATPDGAWWTSPRARPKRPNPPREQPSGVPRQHKLGVHLAQLPPGRELGRVRITRPDRIRDLEVLPQWWPTCYADAPSTACTRPGPTCPPCPAWRRTSRCRTPPAAASGTRCPANRTWARRQRRPTTATVLRLRVLHCLTSHSMHGQPAVPI